MTQTTLRTLRIHWSRPLSSADAIAKFANAERDYGVYQIYGDHVVFGFDSLLYIGSAVRQCFAKRLQQHDQGWMDAHGGIAIRLGHLASDDFGNEPPHWPDWTMCVKNVEALLIYMHSPPYNSRNIQSHGVTGLHVQNWGERGRLMPECTSEWKPARPRDEDSEAG